MDEKENKAVDEQAPDQEEKGAERKTGDLMETKYCSPQITVDEMVSRIKSYPTYIQDMNIKKGIPYDDAKIRTFIEFLNYVIGVFSVKMLEKKEDLLTRFLNEGFVVFPEFCDPENVNALFEKYNQIGFRLQYVDPTLLAMYVNREVIPVPVANYSLMQFLIAKTAIVLHDFVIDPPEEEANKSRIIVGA